MKKLFVIFASAALLFAGCGKEYDDSVLTGRVDGLENRVAKLEELCKQMNTNISSLQTIVTALQNNDYVTAVTPVTRDGETIGYTISFTGSSPITIYHGQNGKDGINGSDGKDGANGADGHTPVIGVRQDADGIYYWTLDGEWLPDNAGNKVKAEGRDGHNGADGKDGADGSDGEDGQDGKDGVNGSDGKDGVDGSDGKDGQNGADGKDGVTPQLKIEDGCWYVSTDNGTTWTNLGKATGEDGKDGTNGADGKNGVDGDQFFRSVDTSNNEYIAFTLADGTMIKLPTWYAFEQLKTLCNQMNTNISSLQSIVTVLQHNDYVTSCTPLMENGKHIGYTVTFAKSNSIVIYHGKDGTNGSDGKGGHSPVIGAKTDTDGVIYWTLDGEWLADESGNKIPVHGRDGINGSDGKDGADGSNGNDGQNGQNGADGKDGVTPQLKIEGGYWYVSTDNGTTWTNLGKATGEDGKDGADGKDGKDGDLCFKSIDTSNNEYIVFTLADGTTIKLPTWHAFEQLRILCNQMNTNINAMQTIVTALQNNDYVKNITPVMQDGREIGYTIIFNKSNPVTIYHGQNGKDGINGSDGKDGANGADGHMPIIGVRQDADGIYYWTLDGEWLLDNAGNKVKAEGRDGQDGADGKDGVTPQLKIEDGYWYVSADNGTTWTNLGKATGENGKDGADGKDGNSFFQSITQDENNVYFTLANEEVITISKSSAKNLSIAFSCGNSLELQSGYGKTITYTIKGGTENNIVKAEVYYPIDNPQYQEITVTPSSADTGSIFITLGTTSEYIYTGTNKILVTVSNGETTIMTTINISVKR